MGTKYLKIKTHLGDFTISSGNSKVQFPIINVGAGLDCSSAKWCPFDQANHKESGRRLCYAQKTEKLYPYVLRSRRLNEAIIKGGKAFELAIVIAEKLLAKVQAWGFDTVRINESGDLAAWNIDFVCYLGTILKSEGIGVYLYSKAPKSLRDKARESGITVLHSERDFVAYGSKEELGQSGAIPCPGICGPCKACPSFSGGKIGILEH